MAKPLKNELQAFSSEFQAQTGKVVEDFSKGIDNFFEKNKDSNTLKIVGGLAAINSTASAEDIAVNYIHKGTFKVGFPKAVRDFPEKVQEKLEVILDVLQTLKTVLEAIRDMIAALSDLIALLLQTIFDTLEDLINMFTSVDAKVRVLPIPPIHPAQTKANSYTIADTATTLAFTALISEMYGDTKISKAYPVADMQKVEDQLLGRAGPNALYADGSSGFLAAINDSFEDAKDPNRPTEAIGYSAGLVIQAGAPTASIATTWTQIKTLLFSLKDSLEDPPVRGPFPSAVINSLEHSGFSERSWPLLTIEIANPSHRAPKDFFSMPTEIYLPIEILIVGAHNTDISPFKAIQEGGYQHLDKYKSITGREKFSELKKTDFFFYRKYYEDNLKSKELSALGVSAFSEQRLKFDFELNRDLLTLNTADSSNLTPIDTLFKVLISYKKFTLQASGDYKEEVFNEAIAPKYLAMSSSFPVQITLDPDQDFLPVLPSGSAPNWIQYGKTWQIPGTEKIVDWLRRLLDDLKSLLTNVTNFITVIINTFIKQIEKLMLIITRLSNIVYLIDKLLDTNIGANMIMFSCDNGVAGIKKAINDHYKEQEAEYTEKRSKGQDVNTVDWFADGESVCGGVIVATSQSLEQVDRLISLLRLIFGGTAEQENSAQGIISDNLFGLVQPELSGFEEGTNDPKGLFTDNFTGISSERHSESPENACDI